MFCNIPEDVICNIAIFANDTTVYSKCDQASNQGQQLEVASELESQTFINYNFSGTRFRTRKTVLGACPCTQVIVHAKEKKCTRMCTCKLLIISSYDGRNCTKLLSKLLAAKTSSLFQSYVLLLCWRSYCFGLRNRFLMNWNKKRCCESNTLTMKHERVLENSSSATVYTLANTIIYLRL